MRRVVVTGIGMVTPIGLTRDASWQALLAGASGCRALTEMPLYNSLLKKGSPSMTVPCAIACDVKDAGRFADTSRESRHVRFAEAAAAEALEQARIDPAGLSEDERLRFGVSIGTGIGSMNDMAAGTRCVDGNSYRTLSPFFVPKILTSSVSGHVSIVNRLRGPNHGAVSACATATHCIGDAFRFIKHGDADVMLAGGSEACINPLAIAGFCRLRALNSDPNETPQTASKPFDKRRAGFVLAEGAAVLVLEEFERAKRRNANIICEVAGYGFTGDGHHVTAPHPQGVGAIEAMSRALREAGMWQTDVNYINAHATSTPEGDEVELHSLQRLFTERAGGALYVSSYKGHVGHLLGAAGAVETAFVCLSLRDQVIVPTRNLQEPVDTLPGGREVHLLQSTLAAPNFRAALKNSFGFGGANASLALRRVDSAS